MGVITNPSCHCSSCGFASSGESANQSMISSSQFASAPPAPFPFGNIGGSTLQLGLSSNSTVPVVTPSAPFSFGNIGGSTHQLGSSSNSTGPARTWSTPFSFGNIGGSTHQLGSSSNSTGSAVTQLWLSSNSTGPAGTWSTPFSFGNIGGSTHQLGSSSNSTGSAVTQLWSSSNSTGPAGMWSTPFSFGNIGGSTHQLGSSSNSTGPAVTLSALFSFGNIGGSTHQLGSSSNSTGPVVTPSAPFSFGNIGGSTHQLGSSSNSTGPVVTSPASFPFGNMTGSAVTPPPPSPFGINQVFTYPPLPPKRFTFGGNPGLEQQQCCGKSKSTGLFDRVTLPAPNLFGSIETPSFGDTSLGKGTTPIPSIFAVNGQAPTVKDSCNHRPPQNPASMFPPQRLFPEPTGIFPLPAENPRQNQILSVNAPASAPFAPIFSWTALPGFGGSCSSNGKRVLPFAPARVPSEGPFSVFHSISAVPGNKGNSHEELRWEHYQNNPMQGKVPVMMVPMIQMPGGGFSILTVQSNLA